LTEVILLVIVEVRRHQPGIILAGGVLNGPRSAPYALPPW
jgi:hypothetical protein